MRTVPKLLAAAALLGLAASAPAAAVQAKASTPQQCFRAMDWRGSSSAGPRDAYIRVGTRDVYHLSFAQDCPGARFPGPLTIGSLVTGNNLICSAVDLQITVGPQGGSFNTSCIVEKIAKLTPDEVSALPKKAVP